MEGGEWRVVSGGWEGWGAEGGDGREPWIVIEVLFPNIS